MSSYRQSLSINARIGTFAKFSSTYKALGTTSKYLGTAGTAGSLLGSYVDYRSMQSGEISGARFGYRLGGTAASFVSSAVMGLEMGGPWGAIGGTAIGGLSWAGERSFDGLIWFRNQLSQGMFQLENSLKSGWYPRR